MQMCTVSATDQVHFQDAPSWAVECLPGPLELVRILSIYKPLAYTCRKNELVCFQCKRKQFLLERESEKVIIYISKSNLVKLYRIRAATKTAIFCACVTMCGTCPAKKPVELVQKSFRTCPNLRGECINHPRLSHQGDFCCKNLLQESIRRCDLTHWRIGETLQIAHCCTCKSILRLGNSQKNF